MFLHKSNNPYLHYPTPPPLPPHTPLAAPLTKSHHTHTMGKNLTLKLFAAAKKDEGRLGAILAGAALANVNVVVGAVDPATASYKHNVHPTGVSPALETQCGRYVAGTHAALKYLAEQGDASYAGRTTYEKCVADSFLELAESVSALTAKTAAPVLKDLNAWLELRTFLVAERISVADVAVAFALLPLYKTLEGRGAYPEVNRWLDTVLNQPKVSPYATGEKIPSLDAAAAPAKDGKKDGKKGGEKDGKTKEKKEKAKKPVPEAAPVDGGLFDLRVGEVKAVRKHPTADSLYIEMIDVGEEKDREICSGLVKHLEPSDIMGKKIIVMCNLKPAKLVGVLSYGMVMCSTGEDGKVLLAQVPEGAKAGDSIIMEKYNQKDKPAQVCLVARYVPPPLFLSNFLPPPPPCFPFKICF